MPLAISTVLTKLKFTTTSCRSSNHRVDFPLSYAPTHNAALRWPPFARLPGRCRLVCGGRVQAGRFRRRGAVTRRPDYHGVRARVSHLRLFLLGSLRPHCGRPLSHPQPKTTSVFSATIKNLNLDAVTRFLAEHEQEFEECATASTSPVRNPHATDVHAQISALLCELGDQVCGRVAAAQSLPRDRRRAALLPLR